MAENFTPYEYIKEVYNAKQKLHNELHKTNLKKERIKRRHLENVLVKKQKEIDDIKGRLQTNTLSRTITKKVEKNRSYLTDRKKPTEINLKKNTTQYKKYIQEHFDKNRTRSYLSKLLKSTTTRNNKTSKTNKEYTATPNKKSPYENK